MKFSFLQWFFFFFHETWTSDVFIFSVSWGLQHRHGESPLLHCTDRIGYFGRNTAFRVMNSQKRLQYSWQPAKRSHESNPKFPWCKASQISPKYLMKAKNITDLVIHPRLSGWCLHLVLRLRNHQLFSITCCSAISFISCLSIYTFSSQIDHRGTHTDCKPTICTNIGGKHNNNDFKQNFLSRVSLYPVETAGKAEDGMGKQKVESWVPEAFLH